MRSMRSLTERFLVGEPGPPAPRKPSPARGRASRGRAAFTVCVLAAAASIAGCGSSADSPPEPPPIPTFAKNVDPDLRKLVDQANRILDGGPEAFEQRLERLRGNPIVVNQWASWCGPCRYEFPFFQELASEYAGRVAFIGVDSKDDRDAAETFLDDYPVPYPHYFDPETEIARVFGGGRAWPTTAFYDADGELVQNHAGAYDSARALEADLRRFALGG
jgi:cytochrome c biogenesis protein CcmG/thiol:disulfide interchange protein DsbE